MIKAIRHISLYLLLVLASDQSVGQSVSESNSPSAILYKLTLQNKFKSADSIIARNDRNLNSDIDFQLAVINFYWWKFISSNDNKVYIKQIDNRIKKIESLCAAKGTNNKNEELHNLFILISGYACNARIHLAEKSYGKVLALLSRYKPVLNNTLGKEVSYAPFYLTSGLYYYVSSQATKKIPLLPYFTGYDAEYERAKGLLYLRKASLLNDQLIQTEARYFLMKIRTELEPDTKEAELYCRLLTTEYPDNILFKYYLIRIQIDKGNAKGALDLQKKFETHLKESDQLNEEEKLYYRLLLHKEMARNK